MANADRSTQLIATIRDHGYDALMSSDVGIFWDNIPVADSWIERTRKLLGPHPFRFSYNRHDQRKDMVQWGGTGIILLGEAKTRLFGTMGSDKDNLGRWTWARLQGRHNFFTRIISAYKPCKNTSDLGSSYQQQLTYFRGIGEFRCPLKMFDLDLQGQLQEWLGEGDQIILGVDLNEDARTGPTSKMLRELGLTDVLIQMHRPDVPCLLYTSDAADD